MISLKKFLNSDRVRRLSGEGFWVVAGQAVAVIGSLMLVRVLTEYLNPEEYGKLALALTLGVLVCQVAFAGAVPGIMRFYANAVEKEDVTGYLVASRKMMLLGTVATFSLGACVLIGLMIAGKGNWLGIVVLAIIFLSLSSYNTTLSAIQNAARQRKLVALHDGFGAWLKIALAVILIVFFGGSAEVVVVAYLLAVLLILISQSVFIRRLIPFNLSKESNHREWMVRIWLYSKPFVFINIFTWMQSSSDRWALEVMVSTNEVGLYAVLMQLGYAPVLILAGLMTTMIGPIFFQRSGNVLDSSRNKSVHKMAWRLTIFTLLLTVLAWLFTYIFHGWIFQLLVAPEYRSVSYLLPWMVLAGGIFSSGQVLSLKLMSDLKTQAMLWPKIITAVIGVLLSFTGAYVAGLEGVVFAAVSFSIIHLIWLALMSENKNDS